MTRSFAASTAIVLTASAAFLLCGCQSSSKSGDQSGEQPPKATTERTAKAPKGGAPVLDGTAVRTSGADEVIKDRRLFPLDLARPDDLAGAIVFSVRKDEHGTTEWYYEPLTTEKPTLQKSEAKLFEAIVDKKFLANASVSIFVSLSASMDNEDKSSILVQDLYTLTGPDRATVQGKIDAWIDKSKGTRLDQAFYCRATRYSTTVSQVYSKVTGSGKVSGPVFGVNGEYYHASSVYTMKPFVTWDGVPIPVPGSKGISQNDRPPAEIKAMKRWTPKG